MGYRTQKESGCTSPQLLLPHGARLHGQSRAGEEEVLAIKAAGLKAGGLGEAAGSARDPPCHRSHLRTGCEYFIGEPEPSLISGERRCEKHTLQVPLWFYGFGDVFKIASSWPGLLGKIRFRCIGAAGSAGASGQRFEEPPPPVSTKTMTADTRRRHPTKCIL